MTAGATIGIKASGCDLAAQQYAGDVRDFGRTVKFATFCALYVGIFQHLVWNCLYPRLFPGTSLAVALRKAAFDNFVHTPLLYLPSYYLFKHVAEGGSPRKALDEYVREGRSVVCASWVFLVPAQVVMFALVPPNFRIGYIGVVGTLWQVVLSHMAPMEAALSQSSKVLQQGRECAGGVAEAEFAGHVSLQM